MGTKRKHDNSSLTKKRSSTQTKLKLVVDGAALRAAQNAANAARAIVANPRDVNTYLSKNSKLRLCWTPTFPFPPVMETTLEWSKTLQTNKLIGTGTDTNCNVFSILMNVIPSKGNSTPNVDLVTDIYGINPVVHNTSGWGAAVMQNPSTLVSFLYKFKSLYNSHVVVSSRVTVQLWHEDTQIQPEGFNFWMKKYIPSEREAIGIDNITNYFTWRPVSSAYPTGGALGTLDYNNYDSQNKGSFEHRAPIFEEGLSKVQIPINTQERPAQSRKASHSSHFSLAADVGVDPTTVIAESSGDPNVDHENEGWAVHDPINFYVKPKYISYWYFWCSLPDGQTRWSSADTRTAQEGYNPATSLPVNDGTNLNMKVVIQYDVVFFNYRKDDEPMRDEI